MKGHAPSREALENEVRQRVSGRLRLGLLGVGDRVPSVRMAAKELGIDPRVVLSAYQQLAADGVLELRPRSGVFVARPKDTATEGSIPSSHRDVQWLIDQFAHALETGIAVPSFADHARRATDSVRLRAVVIDSNDDQLWSTADELTRDYGFETVSIDSDAIDGTKALPLPLRRADVIVTASPSRAIERLAKRSDVPLIGVTMCPDLFAEVRRLLKSEEVYFVVSDARFARKLRAFLAPIHGAKRFYALIYGQDDLRRIPPEAPLYLTRLTRQRMQHGLHPGGGPELSEERRLLNRVLPEARVFSGESSRELIAFLVRANLAAPQSPATRPPAR